ncbi:hypothetical protein [Burkholderia sola]|uniref:hypothetical protein n=1 Tax=Burkholderia sola TaxID=2843302 RepID=UPI0023DE0B04|nr:hypothetical protein [Burkholderia sola]MDF3086571.1 hypothetical protein [Burkholderia sola]
MELIVARIASCGRHRVVLQGFSPGSTRAEATANADYPVWLIVEAVKVNRSANDLSG